MDADVDALTRSAPSEQEDERARRAFSPGFAGMSPHRRGSQGAALIELAIALPLLLVILLGIIDLGRVFYTYEALANAAREGARYCAVNGDCEDSDALSRASSELAGKVTLTAASVTYDAAGPVTVTVKSTFDYLTPLISDLVGGPTKLQVSASMPRWSE